jgi:dihydropteroate synthase
VAERRKVSTGREGGKADRRKGRGPSRPPALPPSRRILFVTGKLAEPALRRVLAEMHADFAAEIAVMRITVAALMTTPWIARHLEVPPGTDLVLLPGLCEGDPAVIADKFGVRVEMGPKDLREIPRHFGGQSGAADYGAWDIEIIAEINNAGRLTREAVLAEAEYFRSSGANLIDIGCTPGRPFPDLGDVVRALVKRGMRISVDSFDPDEIRRAVAAGAELVLSVNSSNRGVIKDLKGSNARVVAIPDFGAPLESLDATLDALERARIRYLVDPVVEPIGFGFLASLERYAAARRRYPEAALMMGVGNITELTAADSTGVNALLMGVCQEVGVKAVLTTEVIPWARGSVRELDIARRLMHHAVTHKVVPKRLDDRLVTLKDPEILAFTDGDLRALQGRVTDSNYRIFTDRDTITVFNSERYVRGTDPQDIFDQLGVSEATHAFYLGRELMKAKTAITLGKTYRQEGALNWGYLTPPDDARREHVRLTQKRSPRAPRRGRA